MAISPRRASRCCSKKDFGGGIVVITAGEEEKRMEIKVNLHVDTPIRRSTIPL